MIRNAKSATRKLVRDPLAFCLDSRFSFLNRYGDEALKQQKKELVTLGATMKQLRVTIIMTAYNTGAYVESALRSILEQSHQSLEVMVIDDASTDETLNILKALSQKDERVKVFSSKVNHGTYWSKNWCLNRATGDFVAFHDSDDVSHPDRIRVQLGAFLKWPELKACTVRWQRILEGRDDCVLMEGRTSRMALISLMIKRDTVLDKVGFFDCVRIAADSEYVSRLGHVFGPHGVRNLRHVLYTGLLREGSLTTGNAGGTLWQLHSDSGESLESSIMFERTLQGERALYHTAFHEWQKLMVQSGKPMKLPFPQEARLFDAPSAITGGCMDHSLETVQEV
jgi:glycosyltransferase involved in cell wall biosynthesis